MESPFRRFLTSKRDRTSVQVAQQDPCDASGQSIASSKPPSIFSYRTSGSANSIKEITLEQHGSQLQAIPYEKTSAGKIPTFVTKPARGNGPVKLQTSRRLSSGELLVTTQDDQRTKDDIREGEYVVGGKHRPSSTARPSKSTMSQSVPTSPASRSGMTSSTSLHSPLAITQSVSKFTTIDLVPSNTSSAEVSDQRSGIPLAATTLDSSGADQANKASSRASSISRLQRDSEATSLQMPRIDEQNPTIAALWRAEQSRLSDMYGHQGLRHNVHQHGTANRSSPLGLSMPTKDRKQISSTGVDLPCQAMSRNNGVEVMRSNSVPALYGDENSDTSSNKRASLISSCAGSSSYTSQTTATDYDSIVTRDDIRKIVDEMRSTYLRAFESNTPSPLTQQPRNARKKRRNKASASSIDSSAVIPTTGLERQTWHGQDESAHAKIRKRQKTRVISQPVIGLNEKNSAETTCAASCSRPTQRLQRADSTTLGSIMAKIENDECDEELILHYCEDLLLPKTPSQSQNSAIQPVSLDDFPSTPKRTLSRRHTASIKLGQ